MVANKSIVGKNDISSTSLTNSVFIMMINATERLTASMTSSIKDGIGIIKNSTAAKI